MTSITKTERPSCDEYTGRLDELIAAGLLRMDQLPPAGKASISYRCGVYQPRRCTMDEHYLRIVVNLEDTVTVQRGLTAAVAAPRKAAQRAESAAREKARQAGWNERERARKLAELAEKAARAESALEEVPKSERQYRRKLVEQLRFMTWAVAADAARPTALHGYRITEESRDAIMIAADALAEAVLQAQVLLDTGQQEGVIAGHRATIRAADPSFAKHLRTLTTLDPAILQGETS